MTIIKALILDDEQNAIEYLSTVIERHLPEIKKVFATSSIDEAKKIINREKPHLLFLDVEMPATSGFEFLKAFPSHDFDVIFTTAFAKYAIQAIRFSALDFLLKPVQPDELRLAFDRFVAQPREIEQRQRMYEQLFDNVNACHDKKLKLTLSKGSRLYFISPTEIFWCMADDNYTKLFLRDNTEFTVSKTLKEVEEMLYDYDFLRTHKSSLVNKKVVSHFKSENVLVLKNGISIEVSRRRLKEAKEALSE